MAGQQEQSRRANRPNRSTEENQNLDEELNTPSREGSDETRRGSNRDVETDRSEQDSDLQESDLMEEESLNESDRNIGNSRSNPERGSSRR